MLPTFSLKGVCDEIFDRYFFHDLNPSGSLISRLKYFRILEFHRDIKIFKKLCSVHPTAVSRKQNTVCLKTLPRASHRRDRLCSLQSAVCIPQWSQASQRASYRGFWLHCVHHTNESVTLYIPTLCLIPSFTNFFSLWCLRILLWK